MKKITFTLLFALCAITYAWAQSGTCHATTPHIIDATTFDNVDKTIPVYVSEGCVEDYQSSVGWTVFNNYQEMAHGTCGDNLLWFYEPSTKVLTITGTGAMTNFGIAANPWRSYPIESVNLPNGITTIGDEAFYECIKLTSITIPNSVTTIGVYAFRGCSSLTGINIPNNVTTIGNGAFYECTALASIDIPNSVTSIGVLAFCGCTELTSITIPNSVTTISGNTFSRCTGLTSITIPNSVTSIGESAFADCTGLTSITCQATTPHIIDETTFDKVDKTIPVYVPEGSVADYQAAIGWKDFTNYQETTTTGIAQNLVAGKELTLQGKTLLFTEIQTVEVYTINGEQVYSGTTQRVDLPQAGVYMVRTPQAVGKVVVR